MTRPIIIDNPMLLIQKLASPGGAPTVDPEVDVSCDVSVVELSPDTALDDVTTFCGTYKVMGDTTWEATIGIVVGPDTSTNWAALVGEPVEFRLYDRSDSTKYRRWESEIPFDPSLGGPTDSGEQTRGFDLTVPVYDGPEWVTA